MGGLLSTAPPLLLPLLLLLLHPMRCAAGAWGEAQQLLASDGAGGDQFGISVAISGEVAVVGADWDNNAGGTNAGAAYIFVRDAAGSGAWTESQKLLASDGAGNHFFGWSVAISGEVAVVGAPWDDNAGGTDAGAAYIFVRDAAGSGAWTESQKLLASDGARNDRFSISVAISGEVAVVGADWDDNAGGTNAGAAYIFVRDAAGSGAWTESQKLLASDGAGGDYFGISVAISGEVVVVGAYWDNNAGGTNAGAAYIFVRDAAGSGAWTESQKLLASDGAGDDQFGISVAISGEVAVVGAYRDDNAGGTDAGAAYIFVRDAVGSGAWTESQKLLASDGAGSDRLGRSVAISGEVAVVGADWDNNAGGDDAGAAYIFVRDAVGSGAWTESQKLLASDGAGSD
eukprot:COSAG02_NODE_1222_length_13800_cov_66.755565_1_plen_399_part_10